MLLFLAVLHVFTLVLHIFTWYANYGGGTYGMHSVAPRGPKFLALAGRLEPRWLRKTAQGEAPIAGVGSRAQGASSSPSSTGALLGRLTTMAATTDDEPPNLSNLLSHWNFRICLIFPHFLLIFFSRNQKQHLKQLNFSEMISYITSISST